MTDGGAVSTILREIRPEVILHCAAFTKVDAAEASEHEASQLNAGSVVRIAEIATEIEATLVYPSTDYVFDGNSSNEYREEDDTNPLSVYGRTKLQGEMAAQESKRYLIVRTSWVFGAGHNFIMSILRAGTEKDELQVVADQVGRPTYALDLAGGILDLLDAKARGTFHLAGGGSPCSWADLAEHALRHKDLDTKVIRVSTAEFFAGREGAIAPRPAFTSLDCSKAASLGVALRPWQQAVDEYLKEAA